MTASSYTQDGPARPPTPPKDHSDVIDDAIAFLDVDYTLDENASKTPKLDSGISTPPRSSPLSSKQNSSVLGKKVGFRSWTTQHHETSPQKTTPLRPLPQTRDARPLKSILKSQPYYTPTPEDDHNSPAGYFQLRLPQNVPKMLESVSRLLASNDPLMVLDGYQILTRALKAYSNFPDEVSLRAQVPHLERCVLRDTQSTSQEPQTINITTQALKLSVTLFHMSSMTSAITSDFRDALLDRALTFLSMDTINKAIGNHYLYLLASPSFSPRSLSITRLDVLLSRLEKIHFLISGNSVVAARLTIYQRLIERQSTAMGIRLASWLEHVFHACLSSHDDISRRGLECGALAARLYGTQSNAHRFIFDLLSSKTSDDRTFGDYFFGRLTVMVRDAAKSAFVPQIWAMLVLFYRNRRKSNAWWRKTFKTLLAILQECMTVPDLRTRAEAISAWNRLVYTSDLGSEETDPKDDICKLLIRPYKQAFDRQNDSVETRKIYYSGYVALLYHAFEPNQSFERLDILWTQYVSGLTDRLLKRGGRDTALAVGILKALFFDGKQSWSADRIFHQSPIRVDELPRLDVKWVRSRLPMILQSLGSWLAPTCAANVGHFTTPWPQLVKAVATAGATDVITSKDTKESLAQLLDFLQMLWATAARWLGESGADVFISHWTLLVLDIVEAFKPAGFLEDALMASASNGSISAAPSKSIPPKANGRLCSAFAVTLQNLTMPNESLDDGESILAAAQDILNAVLRQDTTTLSRLKVLRRSVTLIAELKAARPEAGLRLELGDILLTGVNTVLCKEKEIGTSSADVEHIRRETVAVLAESLKLQRDPVLQGTWINISNALADILRRAAGAAYVQIGLLNPLVKVATTDYLTLQIRSHLAQFILTKIPLRLSHEELKKAQKAIDGSRFGNANRVTFSASLHEVFTFIASTLEGLYDQLDSCDVPALALLQDLLPFMQNLDLDLFPDCLAILQKGVSALVRDGLGLLSPESETTRAVRRKVFAIWKVVLERLAQRLADPQTLDAFTTLLEAGFCSTHRSIVNALVMVWNSAFSEATDMRYPEPLIPTLARLAECIDIELPTFPSTSGLDMKDVRLPAFDAETKQDPLSDDDTQETRERSETPGRMMQQFLSMTPKKTPLAAIAGRHAIRTPPSKAHPLPRLRHEDSQIEFIRIENLPSELTEDGSQGLTDHQKEVYERQQEGARLFLQINSSPAPPSTGKNLIRDRVEHELSVRKDTSRLLTPEPVAEDQMDADADEFLASSPMARSAERRKRRNSSQTTNRPTNISDLVLSDEVAEGAILDHGADDVPSSPPEIIGEDPLDNSIVGATTHDANNLNDEPEESDERVEETRLMVTSDAEKIAPISSHDQTKSSTRGSPILYDISALSNSFPHEEAGVEVAQTMAASTDRLASSEGEVGMHGETTSNVLQVPHADAVIDSGDHDKVHATSDPVQETVLIDRAVIQDAIEDSPVGSRKRKAADIEEPVTVTKRHKKTSPIKRIFSWMGVQFSGMEAPSSIQDEEDDGLEDCIVVATQPEETHTTMSQEIETEQAASQPTQSAKSIGRRSKKQRRSINPRKVQTSSPIRKRTTRRAGSQGLSPMKTEGDLMALQSTDIRMVAVQPLRRSGRLQASRESCTSASSPSPVRSVRAESSASAETDHHTHNDVVEYNDNHMIVDTDSAQVQTTVSNAGLTDLQSVHVQEANEAEATPKTIYGRLKDILDDVREMGKKFVLGSQDQMDISGMLFELGNEVHAASRRTRAGATTD